MRIFVFSEMENLAKVKANNLNITVLQRLTGGVSNLPGIGVSLAFPFQFTSLKETDFPDGLHSGGFAVPGSFPADGYISFYLSRTGSPVASDSFHPRH